MMPRSQRLALWCLALALTLPLYIKGRIPTPQGEDAAFSRFTGQTVTVRLTGDLPRTGVYRFPKGVAAAAAIKMTLPVAEVAASVRGSDTRELASGDVVAISRDRSGKYKFLLSAMTIKERMLLGVPLDPDLLSEEEWALLTGIGAALSRRIIEDRHENGAFGAVEGLLRVPGIGQGKLAAIKRYF
ncbi:helix-hairpin-helix domain-containing protein [Geomonas terrae]|uniref:Helix-hairpin-helix domain-containing protein n=1 Tax=Geomonas terrae TaxID=2562681 RepID=A0A4S1CD10_9BACT|nr:helix-hairpin-helix domain-containing protein [Geomonas terrae]TGU70876.1 helix-hairpin-helix domain-containing protein [Geomonas terrae]